MNVYCLRGVQEMIKKEMCKEGRQERREGGVSYFENSGLVATLKFLDHHSS